MTNDEFYPHAEWTHPPEYEPVQTTYVIERWVQSDRPGYTHLPTVIGEYDSCFGALRAMMEVMISEADHLMKVIERGGAGGAASPGWISWAEGRVTALLTGIVELELGSAVTVTTDDVRWTVKLDDRTHDDGSV